MGYRGSVRHSLESLRGFGGLRAFRNAANAGQSGEYDHFAIARREPKDRPSNKPKKIGHWSGVYMFNFGSYGFAFHPKNRREAAGATYCVYYIWSIDRSIWGCGSEF